MLDNENRIDSTNYMKTLILSDLHLDHWEKRKNDKLIKIINSSGVDCILCAGDLCAAQDTHDLDLFLTALSIPLFYVMGNHDAYGSSYKEAKAQLRSYATKNPYFNFLDNEVTTFQDYIIIGSPLYTDFNLYGKGPIEVIDQKYYNIRDFTAIRKNGFDICGTIVPQDYVSLHLDAKEFIKNTIEANPDKKLIVLTHWMPSPRCISLKFAGDSHNPYFATNCDELFYLNESVKYWVYGHTHETNRLEINTTTCICNPRGYPGEMKNWKSTNFIVDI